MWSWPPASGCASSATPACAACCAATESVPRRDRVWCGRETDQGGRAPAEQPLPVGPISHAGGDHYHLAGECRGVQLRRPCHGARQQDDVPGVIAVLEHVVAEHEVPAVRERRITAAMHERDRAIGHELHAIERIALEERAVVPARLQSDPAELRGYVGSHFLELRARRIAAREAHDARIDPRGA